MVEKLLLFRSVSTTIELFFEKSFCGDFLAMGTQDTYGGGEKRVGTGPDRKGECIVYSTPPSSRLPISVTAIGFPDN